MKKVYHIRDYGFVVQISFNAPLELEPEKEREGGDTGGGGDYIQKHNLPSVSSSVKRKALRSYKSR